MVSNIYLNDLSRRAKKDDFARWRLGELLHEAEMEGMQVIIDKKNKLIEVKECRNYED